MPPLPEIPVLLSVTVTSVSVAPRAVAASAPAPAVTTTVLPPVLSTVMVPPEITVPSLSVSAAPDTSMPLLALRSVTNMPSRPAPKLVLPLVTSSSAVLSMVSVPADGAAGAAALDLGVVVERQHRGGARDIDALAADAGGVVVDDQRIERGRSGHRKLTAGVDHQRAAHGAEQCRCRR